MQTARLGLGLGTLARAVLLLATVSGVARATDRTWTGTAGDGNWDTPANWGGTKPGANDQAVFDGSVSNTGPTTGFSGGESTGGLIFQNGYTGKISLDGNLSIQNGGGSATGDMTVTSVGTPAATSHIELNGNTLLIDAVLTLSDADFVLDVDGGTFTMDGAGGNATINASQVFRVRDTAGGGLFQITEATGRTFTMPTTGTVQFDCLLQIGATAGSDTDISMGGGGAGATLSLASLRVRGGGASLTLNATPVVVLGTTTVDGTLVNGSGGITTNSLLVTGTYTPGANTLRFSGTGTWSGATSYGTVQVLTGATTSLLSNVTVTTLTVNSGAIFVRNGFSVTGTVTNNGMDISGREFIWDPVAPGSFSSGANWTPTNGADGAAPGATDLARFNGTSNQTCTVDATTAIEGLALSAGTANVLFDNVQLTVSEATVVNAGELALSGTAGGAGAATGQLVTASLSLSGGTISLGVGQNGTGAVAGVALEVGAALTVTGGTFTPTANGRILFPTGGTLTDNVGVADFGRVTHTGAADPANNLIMNASGATISVSAYDGTTGAALLNLNDKTLVIRGGVAGAGLSFGNTDFVTDTGADGGAPTYRFSGADGSATWTASGTADPTQSFFQVEVAGGTVTLGSNVQCRTLTISGGTLDLSNRSLIVNDGAGANGTVVVTANAAVQGNVGSFTVENTFTVNTGVTLSVTGTTQTVTVSATNGFTTTGTGALDLNGNTLNLPNSTLNGAAAVEGGLLNVIGTLALAGTVTTGTGELQVSGATTLSGTSSIAGGTGTVDLDGNLTGTGSVTVTTAELAGGTVTLSTIDYTQTSGTTTFNGGACALTVTTDDDFFNVDKTGTGTLTVTNTNPFLVNGTLTLTSGNLTLGGTSGATFAGDVSLNGNQAALGANLVTFTGSAFSFTAAAVLSNTGGTLQFTRTSGSQTVTFDNDGDVTGTGASLASLTINRPTATDSVIFQGSGGNDLLQATVVTVTSGVLDVRLSSTFTAGAGVALTVQTAGQFVSNTGTGLTHNFQRTGAGNVIVLNGGGDFVVTDATDDTNTTTVNVTASTTIDLNGSSTFTLAGTATRNLDFQSLTASTAFTVDIESSTVGLSVDRVDIIDSTAATTVPAIASRSTLLRTTNWLVGIVWSGLAGDGSWTNGANWIGGVTPGSTDVAIFNAAGAANSPPTTNATALTAIGGIRVFAAYTQLSAIVVSGGGTLTLNGDLVFDGAGGAKLQVSGSNTLAVGGNATFTGGAGTSNWIISGALTTTGNFSFTASSTTTLSINSGGAVTVTGATTYTGTTSSSLTLAGTAALNANGTFSFTGGGGNSSLGTGTIFANGASATLTGTLGTTAGGTLRFNGGGTTTLSASGVTFGTTLRVDSGTTVNVSTVTAGLAAVVIDGILDLTAAAADITATSITGTGSLDGSGVADVTVSGDLTVTSFTAGALLTLTSTGDWTGASNFGTVTVSGGTRTATTTINTGALTVSGGTLALGANGLNATTGTISAAVTSAGGKVDFSGAVGVSGAGGSITTGAGELEVGGLVTLATGGTINGSGGLVDLDAGLTGTGSLTVNAAELSGGNVTLTNVTFSHPSGTVTFDGGTITLALTATQTFTNVAVTAGSVQPSANPLVVNGTLAITGGGTLTLATNNVPLTVGTTTSIGDGATAGTLRLRTTGTPGATFGGNLSVGTTAGSLLHLGSGTVAFRGDVTLTNLAAANFTGTTSTVTFDRTVDNGAQAVALPATGSFNFGAVTIARSTTAAQVNVTDGGGATFATGTLTVTTGTLDVRTTLTVGGNGADLATNGRLVNTTTGSKTWTFNTGDADCLTVATGGQFSVTAASMTIVLQQGTQATVTGTATFRLNGATTNLQDSNTGNTAVATLSVASTANFDCGNLTVVDVAGAGTAIPLPAFSSSFDTESINWVNGRVWTGLGAAGQWDDGANWSGGAVPAAGVQAIFNSTSDTSANVPNQDIANISPFGGIRVFSTYTRLITIDGSVSLATPGDLNFDGTGGADLTVASGATLSVGGAFTYTAGAGADSDVAFQTNTAVNVTGALIFTGSTNAGSTFTLGSAVGSSAALTVGGTFTYTGGTTSRIALANAGTPAVLAINGASASITGVLGGGTGGVIRFARAGTTSLTIGASTTLDATVQVGDTDSGTTVQTVGTNTLDIDALVVDDDAPATTNRSTLDLANANTPLTVNGSATFENTARLLVDDVTGLVTVAGNWSSGGGVSFTLTGSLSLSGAGATVSVAAGDAFRTVTLNAAGGGISQLGGSGLWTINTLDFNGAGGLTLGGGGLTVTTSCTVDVGNLSLNGATATFNNGLVITNSVLVGAGTLNVNAAAASGGGTLNAGSGAVNVAAGLTVATYTPGTATLTFSGDGLWGGVGGQSYGTVVVSGAGTDVTIDANDTNTVATLAIAGSVVVGTGETLVTAGTSTTPITGAGVLNGTGGTVRYRNDDGTAAPIDIFPSVQYGTLEVSDPALNDETYRLVGTTEADDIALTAGALVTNGQQLTIDGTSATPVTATSGTFTGSPGTVIYTTNAAGTITVHPTSYGTLRLNNGTETYALAGTSTVGTLDVAAGVFSTGGTLTVNTATTISGTLTITGGTADMNGTFSGAGTVTQTGGTLQLAAASLDLEAFAAFDNGATAGTVELDGTFPKTIDLDGNVDFPTLVVNGGAVSFTGAATPLIDVNVDLTLTSGSLAIGTFPLDVDGNVTGGGTLNASGGGTVNIGGDLTATGYTAGAGLLTLDGAAGSTWQGTGPFGNVSVTATTTLGSGVSVTSLTVTSTLSLSSFTVTVVGGNLSVTGNTISPGTGGFRFDGTSTWSGAGVTSFGNVSVRVAGAVTLGTNVACAGVNIDTGTSLTLAGFTLTLLGNGTTTPLVVTGPAGLFDGDTGTTIFASATAGTLIPATSAQVSYQNVQVTGTATHTFQGTSTISGTLTVNNNTTTVSFGGDFAANTITATDGTVATGANTLATVNLSVASGADFTVSTGGVTFSSTGNWTDNQGVTSFGVVQRSGAGTTTVGTPVTAGTVSVPLAGGAFALGTNRITTGSFDVATGVNGVTSSGAGGVTFSGTGTWSGSAVTSFGVVVKNGAGTLTVNTAVTAAGATINAGVVALGNNVLTTSGDLTVTGAGLTVGAPPSLGGVTFTGAGTWTGASVASYGAVTKSGTGTVTLGSNVTARTVSVTAATLALGGLQLTLEGDTVSTTVLTVAGGTYTGNGTTRFTSGVNGTLIPATTANLTFQNVLVEGSGDHTFSGAATLTGSLTVNNAASTVSLGGATSVDDAVVTAGVLALGANTLTTAGDLTVVGAGLTVSTGGVTFTGTGSWSGSGVATFGNVLKSTAGTTTLLSAVEANDVDVTGGTLALANFVLITNSDLTVTGTLTVGSGGVQFDGTGAWSGAGVTTFGGVTVSSTAVVTASGASLATAALNVQASGQLLIGTTNLTCTGAVTLSGAFVATTTHTLTLAAPSGTQSFNPGADGLTVIRNLATGGATDARIVTNPLTVAGTVQVALSTRLRTQAATTITGTTTVDGILDCEADTSFVSTVSVTAGASPNHTLNAGSVTLRFAFFSALSVGNNATVSCSGTGLRAIGTDSAGVGPPRWDVILSGSANQTFLNVSVQNSNGAGGPQAAAATGSSSDLGNNIPWTGLTAIDVIWLGAGSPNNRWDVAANWFNGVVPFNGCNIVFDGTQGGFVSGTGPTVWVGTQVSLFSTFVTRNAYNGTIRLGNLATTFSGAFTHQVGAFDANGNTLRFNGNATINLALANAPAVQFGGASAQVLTSSLNPLTFAGTLTIGVSTATSVTLATPNGVQVDGAFTIDPAATLTTAGAALDLNGAATVGGALTATGSAVTFSGATWNATGAGVVSFTGAGSLTFDGTAAQTVSFGAEDLLRSVTIANAAGVTQGGTSAAWELGSNLNVNTGPLQLVAAGGLDIDGFVTVSATGSLNIAGATVTVGAGNNAAFVSNGPVTDSAGTGTLVLEPNSAGDSLGGAASITVGNLTIGGPTLNGMSTMALSNGNVTVLQTLTVDPSRTLAGGNTGTGGLQTSAWTLNGTYLEGQRNTGVSGAMTVGGSGVWTNDPTGLLVFNRPTAGTQALAAGGANLGNARVNNGVTGVVATVQLTNNVTFTALDLNGDDVMNPNGQVLTIAGNGTATPLTIAAAANLASGAGAGTVRFTSAVAVTLPGITFRDLTLDSTVTYTTSTPSLTVNGALTLNVAGATLSGTFPITAGSIGGTGTLALGSQPLTLTTGTIAGTVIVTGATGVTITFQTPVTIPNLTYGSLTLNGGAFTVTGGALAVQGTLTFQGGASVVAATTITFSGAGPSTLQAGTAPQNFAGLTLNKAAAGTTLTLTAVGGAIRQISGTVNITQGTLSVAASWQFNEDTIVGQAGAGTQGSLRMQTTGVNLQLGDGAALPDTVTVHDSMLIGSGSTPSLRLTLGNQMRIQLQSASSVLAFAGDPGDPNKLQITTTSGVGFIDALSGGTITAANVAVAFNNAANVTGGITATASEDGTLGSGTGTNTNWFFQGGGALLLSSATALGDGTGRINRVRMTFTRQLNTSTLGTNFSAFGLKLGTGTPVTGTAINLVTTTNNDTVDVTFGAGVSTTATDNLSLVYTAPASGRITSFDGISANQNITLDGTTTTPRLFDAAAPTLALVATQDLDANGGLDRIVFEFSEPVGFSGRTGVSLSGFDPVTSTASLPIGAELTLRIAGETLTPIPVDGAGPQTSGANVAARIQSAVRDYLLTSAATLNKPAIQNFTCTFTDGRYVLSAGVPVRFVGGTYISDYTASTVEVVVGGANDASALLKLGVPNGGTERPGAGNADPGVAVSSGTGSYGPSTATLSIGQDGFTDFTVTASGLVGVANDLQSLVRAKTARSPACQPAYDNFCAVADTGAGRLILVPGTTGSGSGVVVDSLSTFATTAIIGSASIPSGAIERTGTFNTTVSIDDLMLRSSTGANLMLGRTPANVTVSGSQVVIDLPNAAGTGTGSPAYLWKDLGDGGFLTDRAHLVIASAGLTNLNTTSNVVIVGDTDGDRQLLVSQGQGVDPGTPTVDASATVAYLGTAGVTTQYSWAFVSGPATPLSVTTTGPVLQFQARTAGIYRFRLTIQTLDAAGQPAQSPLTDNLGRQVVLVDVEIKALSPVASAGPDQVLVGTVVQLDGSGSFDPNGGSSIAYEWSGFTASGVQLPSSVFSDAAAVQPTFTPTSTGTFTIRLTVRKSPSGLSASDDMLATVIDSANLLPVADGGPDLVGRVNTEVTLDGSRSCDPEGAPLTFTWSILSSPQPSTLTGSTTAQPRFVPSVPGSYVLQLVVSDGTVNSLTDTVTVIVIDDATTTPRRAPGAVARAAGLRRAAFLATPPADLRNATIALVLPDGTQRAVTIKDVAGDATDDPTASATAGLTQVRLVSGLTVLGEVYAQLLTGDDDPVSVVVDSTTQPILSFGVAGEPFTLDGTRSQDDGLIQTFTWTWVSGPSQPFTSRDGSLLAVTPLTGAYVFDLVVTDAIGLSSLPARIVIPVVPASQPEAAPPTPMLTVTSGGTAVASPGTDLEPLVVSVDTNGSGAAPLQTGPATLSPPRVVVLSASTTVYRGGATAGTFTWAQLAGPQAILSGQTTDTLSVTMKIEGAYAFGIQVTDSDGVTNFAIAWIVVGADPPIARLTTGRRVQAGTTITLDGSGSTGPSGLTYQWSQLEGAPVVLTAQQSSATTTLDIPGTYRFSLRVSSGGVTSAPATVKVRADGTPDQQLATGATTSKSSGGCALTPLDPPDSRSGAALGIVILALLAARRRGRRAE